MLGFGSSVCGRREQLQGAQPRSPSAVLAARSLRCSGGEDVQLSVYSPCDLHSTQPAQPLAHVMSFNHPSLLQTGKEATTLVSSQVISGGTRVGTWVIPLGVSPGVHGPGSFLWACHLVSRDLGLSSGRVTWCPWTPWSPPWCPWRGQGLRWGLQLLGTVDASQLVPLARTLLLSWGSMVRYSESVGGWTGSVSKSGSEYVWVSVSMPL